MLCALCGFTPAFADPTDFLLIRRNAQTQTIRLASVNDQFVEHLPSDKNWDKVPLDQCIALLNPAAKMKERTTGLVLLADGQRLPGEAALNGDPAPEALAWNHPWLGRIDVPLKHIASVALNASASAPAPAQLDVIRLNNGDQQEGLVMSLGRSIVLEVTRGSAKQNVEIPLNLVAAITLVTPPHAPAASARRLWFDDGTVIDAPSISIGEDGFIKINGSDLIAGTQPTRAGLAQIAAILLDPRAMIPLATLTPARVEGPPTRYLIPKPGVVSPEAPLGLSAIECSGPITVRYTAPIGATHLIAEAELPKPSRTWGDYELVIRSNDSEIFRARLNGANPSAAINVALSSREITIELLEGGNGPIQDRIILQRPMLLLAR